MYRPTNLIGWDHRLSGMLNITKKKYRFGDDAIYHNLYNSYIYLFIMLFLHLDAGRMTLKQPILSLYAELFWDIPAHYDQ
jgi:hypothetical protein